MSERELTYGEAVKEAIAEEMRRDPRVFLIGEDVAEAGHPFKTLVGLVQEFGTQRIIDTPISEPGYAGIGVGAAMTGMRTIVDVMFGDFITLTMDQMVNQAARRTTCRAARSRCRSCSARRWARRAGRPRSTRSRCTRGSATFPASRWRCPRARTRPRA